MTSSTASDRDRTADVVHRYERFARLEAPGRSPYYAEVAALVAADAGIVHFLVALPPPKRQPNLLFAAVRYLFGTPSSPGEFVELIRAHPDELAALMAIRRTQTNEPARCATLLPVLAGLRPPLALLEVGASAGLCLLPDHYEYDYGRRRITPSMPSAVPHPVFWCRADPRTPLPEGNLEVAWRAGLDLSPIDLRDEAEVRWLEALVWPGQEYRLAPLRAACEVARAHPPRLVAGDLRTDLAALARQAPADATLVVFHTAVLAYVMDADDRAAFARTVGDLGAVWIANESPTRIPGISPEIRRGRPPRDEFLLTVDGAPTAWTDGHGTFIEWR